MFEFAYPYFFLLLIPIFLWAGVSLKKRPPAVTYSEASRLGWIAGKNAEIRARIPLLVRTLALVLLVAAVARPQTVDASREIKTPGVDIILCLDASESMAQPDFAIDGQRVNRLTAVKKVVHDFVKRRDTDRIGLVVFGDYAFTQAPLTLDKGLLLNLIENLRIGMAGRKTAIGDALGVAGKRIKDIPAMSKVVILLSDGENTAGDMTPQSAAEALAALGIKIYTIGMGTQQAGSKELAQIAAIGQGKYYHASNTEQLDSIYKEIDKAEKTEAKVKEFFHYKEHYRWFLLAALALVLLEAVGLLGRAVP
ncbi:Ca-activated chloride channel family protein [Desulfatibacillum alkenivorans DSM 16219]|jgi:Ca-activated chloride channel family protein|uniref:Ca-activated chloride channel family protein n=1 Tax=Desulfatibacillum alkenivorans DSM 16219 TaxID=1121393 RepID=A0A1M6K162_9BACT|nr:VWA domain-containing protein [Desulfatibacillum alkenivorans]SHJ52696.1 Ca-activated chloride channel family protein [Desulfatibacillum alkenivorans DSM 16219]